MSVRRASTTAATRLRATSSREGGRSSAFIEAEVSSRKTISRPRMSRVSKRSPHCGRASARMRKAKAASSSADLKKSISRPERTTVRACAASEMNARSNCLFFLKLYMTSTVNGISSSSSHSRCG